MAETNTKIVSVVIQGITVRHSERGQFHTIETQPRPGRQYPDKYNVWDAKLVEGLKAGDAVALNIQRGNPKKENPQYDSDYYWETLSIQRVANAPPSPAPGMKAPGEGVGLGQAPAKPPIPPNGDPWHRWISWAELVGQARLMVENTLAQEGLVGNTPAREGEGKPKYQALYAERFMWAMELICARIRAEMGR